MGSVFFVFLLVLRLEHPLPVVLWKMVGIRVWVADGTHLRCYPSHRFAAGPSFHEPRAATPSATHTLMLLWKYLVNKITPEHIKCDWVRCYNVGHVACLVCIITPEDASFLCSHRAFLSLSIRVSFFF